MLGIIMGSHIFPQIKFGSTYSTCVQMNIHVLLQLLITREYLKAHLAYRLTRRQMGNHMAHMVMFSEVALITNGTDIPGHALVHIIVQSQLTLP